MTTFIVLICLLLFLFLTEATFSQVPKLISEIIKDDSFESIKDMTSAILSIGILVGMTFGVEAMVTRLMYFFNLDEFAESKKIKFKKRTKKEAQNDSKKETKTQTKTVEANKNIFKQSNQTVANKINSKKANNETENKVQNAMKPFFVKIFDTLKGLKKDNVTSKTT
ncbi:UNVERIFIED_CONTAM: hypothetical protein O8I53_13590 [Campylobacter lari]